MTFQYRNQHPCFPCGDRVMYTLEDYWLVRYVDAVATDRFDINLPLPPDAPAAWLRQFWAELTAAPRLTPQADQWCSHHLSLLGDRVVVWREDRKDGTDSLDRAVPVSDFLEYWGTPEEKHWLLQQVLLRQQKEGTD